MPGYPSLFVWLSLSICSMGMLPQSQEKVRTEHFDKDPGWDAVNNHATQTKARTVRQDFGYSNTAHAGGQPGEVGGFISTAAEPAYYARKLETKTLGDPLIASGRLVCGEGPVHVMLGFFNAETINEWRTPNTISIRLQGRGSTFYAYVEYATSKWRAGGNSPGKFATDRETKTVRMNLRDFPINTSLLWSLKYDPDGNHGAGSITVKLDSETTVCHLSQGHKADGAVFNRFGLLNVMKSADGGGEVWLDDVTINGIKDDFSADPHWDAKDNRRTYSSANIRPRFDFGYSPTRYASGQSPGELGGLIFRGDCRHPARMAAYGDWLKSLSMDKPLKAMGKVALRRAVTDSTVLLGFYHSRESMEVNPSQDSGIPRSFFGIAIEGPSREGFFFYPLYRNNGDGQGSANGPQRPRIYPDGKSHDFTLRYDPEAASGKGQVVVTLDQQSVSLDLDKGHRTPETRFDRFGLITTWIDGNGQQVYFDDLTYTIEQ